MTETAIAKQYYAHRRNLLHGLNLLYTRTLLDAQEERNPENALAVKERLDGINAQITMLNTELINGQQTPINIELETDKINEVEALKLLVIKIAENKEATSDTLIRQYLIDKMGEVQRQLAILQEAINVLYQRPDKNKAA